MRNFHQHGIDTRGRISGRIKTICPQCNDTRGHKGNKMDTHRPRTGATPARHGHEPLLPTVHARAGTADD